MSSLARRASRPESGTFLRRLRPLPAREGRGDRRPERALEAPSRPDAIAWSSVCALTAATSFVLLGYVYLAGIVPDTSYLLGTAVCLVLFATALAKASAD